MVSHKYKTLVATLEPKNNLRAFFVAGTFTFTFTCAIVVLLCSFNANAQLYKWTDENGKVQYTDAMPPGATDRSHKIMRSDGMVNKEVDRAPTPEERRAAAIKADVDAKARTAREERERKDKALLATYSNLTDFDRVRDRAIAVVNGEIAAFGRQLTVFAERRVELGTQVETSGKKGPNAKLAADVVDADLSFASMSKLQTTRQKDRDELVKNYARERLQLVDLMAAQAANNPNGMIPSATTATTAKTAATAPTADPAKSKNKP